MIKITSPISELFLNEKVKNLKPITFKAYIYFLQIANEDNKIINFSVRKQANQWTEMLDFKMTTNKNMVNSIIKELSEADLILVDKANKYLLIK